MVQSILACPIQKMLIAVITLFRAISQVNFVKIIFHDAKHSGHEYGLSGEHCEKLLEWKPLLRCPLKSTTSTLYILQVGHMVANEAKMGVAGSFAGVEGVAEWLVGSLWSGVNLPTLPPFLPPPIPCRMFLLHFGPEVPRSKSGGCTSSKKLWALLFFGCHAKTPSTEMNDSSQQQQRRLWKWRRKHWINVSNIIHFHFRITLPSRLMLSLPLSLSLFPLPLHSPSLPYFPPLPHLHVPLFLLSPHLSPLLYPLIPLLSPISPPPLSLLFNSSIHPLSSLPPLSLL